MPCAVLSYAVVAYKAAVWKRFHSSSETVKQDGLLVLLELCDAFHGANTSASSSCRWLGLHMSVILILLQTKKLADIYEDGRKAASPLQTINLEASREATTKELGLAGVALPQDEHLVTFDQSYDADNPRDWHTCRKWLVTGLLSATGFNRMWCRPLWRPLLAQTLLSCTWTTPSQS